MKTNLRRMQDGLFFAAAIALTASHAASAQVFFPAQNGATRLPSTNAPLPSNNIHLQPNNIPLPANNIHLQPNNIPLNNGQPVQQPFQTYQQPYFQQQTPQPYPNVALPQNQLLRPNNLQQNPYAPDYQQPNQFQRQSQDPRYIRVLPLLSQPVPQQWQNPDVPVRQTMPAVRRQPSYPSRPRYTQPQGNYNNYNYNPNTNRDLPPGTLPPSAFAQPQPHQLVQPMAQYKPYFPPTTLSSVFLPFHDINAGRYHTYNWGGLTFNYGFPGYCPRPIRGTTCVAPFGVGYGCPQYISTTYVITSPYVYASGYDIAPVEPFEDTDAYVVADAARARSLRAALNDLTRTWEENDARALRRRVASDLSVAVFQQEKFVYSLKRADFIALAADAIDHVQTISFKFDDVQERNDGLVNAYATHRYRTRTEGGKATEQSAQVRCTLIFVDGDWYLSAISLAPGTVN